ncbi:MAG: S-layer homology domain-containing protein [Oscillospiraceae bacterium]|nr:S-layer homology domain-containing protein [Oscillospiraceae bacterium]
MIADIQGKTAYATVGNNWLIFATDEDGTYTGEYTYDIAEHLYFLANNQTLKVVNAFSNYGLDWGSQNEDNLFGSATDYYSPFEYLSWYLDNVDNEVGYDDTGLTWDQYMDTDAGEYLSMQIRMTSAVDYLVEPGDATPATYWYVRHGVMDRDTSFAVESTLFYSLVTNTAIDNDNINTGFAWLQGHAGNYDVQEAYTWLADVLAAEETEGPDITVTTSVSSKTITVKVTSDEDADYTIVLTDEDGEEVDTQTASGTSATVKFTGLTNGDEYTVTVTAVNSDGGETTKTKTATPKATSGGSGSGSSGSSSGGSIISGGTTTTTGTFSDVSTDDYYYDAVEWAVANGITTGTSDTTFSPDSTCTRGQVVTFLYRYDSTK